MPFGHFEAGRILVMLNRGDYWQCIYIIPKSSAGELMKLNIEDFRRKILALSPWLAERVNELKSWDDVKPLSVALDRLPRWYRPGLLCIGDAAHAMSPIGGVGINLALQDAVAAANILAEPLRAGTVTLNHLARVQARCRWPTRATQAPLRAIQNRVIRAVLASTAQPKPPLAIKLLDWFPTLRGIAAGDRDRGEARARPDQRGETRLKRTAVSAQRKTQRRSPQGKEMSSRVSIRILRASIGFRSGTGIPY
jgi:2-polyprenyl-6-methoxyphenol hydroxylase-like FAD-dependent oxidoreductase